MASVVAVVRDLIFATKLAGTARELGIQAGIATTIETLQTALDEGGVRLVIVDMGLEGNEAAAALRCAANHTSRPTTLAFYSHVQSELAEAARSAGADIVLPRSKFSAQLPALLRQHCSQSD